MPGQGAMVRALKKGAKKAVKPKESEFGLLDQFLKSVGDPANITDDQLRQWNDMIPNLSAADRTRGSRFLGLDPASKFPNRRILSRAGIGEPFEEALQAPAGGGWQTDLSKTVPMSKPDPVADAFANQMRPHNPALDAFANQISGGGIKPKPKSNGYAKYAGLGALAGGAAGLGMREPSDDIELPDPGSPSPFGSMDSLINRMEQPTQRPTAQAKGKVKGGGVTRPRTNSAMLSGLTGVNGAPSPSINFGTPQVDFTEMFKQPAAASAAVPEKNGNGIGNFLKTMGPLLAALFFGKMLD